jgi:hypothetical protein
MNAIMFSQIGLETDEVLASWRFLDPGTRGILLVFCSIGLITLMALVWVTFFRKRGRRRRKHHHAQESPSLDEILEIPKDEGAPSPPKKRRHRRRSGRHHRPRNPTLAETGGLPPVRPEDAPGPQP